MSSSFSICCFKCGKIFQPLVRRPLTGLCSHAICSVCRLSQDSPICPLCGKEDSFPNPEAINFSLEQILEERQFGDFSQSSIGLYTGKCSECPGDGKLFFCVSCSTEQMIVKNSENKWQLKPGSSPREFLKVRARSICSDCGFNHRDNGHELVALEGTNFITNNSGGLGIRTQGAVLEQQIQSETGCGEWQQVVIHFKILELRYRIRTTLAQNFRGSSNDVLGRMPGVELSEDTDPNILQVMKHSREKLRKSQQKDEHLSHMMVIYEIRHLGDFLKVATALLEKEQEGEKRENVILELENTVAALSETFLKMPVDLMTEEEIDRIDKEVSWKMELMQFTIRQKYPITTLVYLKYRSIMEEMKESSIQINKTNPEMRAKGIECFNLSKRIDPLIKQIDEMLSFDPTPSTERDCLLARRNVYTCQLLEMQLAAEEAIFRFSEASNRVKIASLMKIKWFAAVPGETGEHEAYRAFLDEFREQNLPADSMTTLF